MRQLWEGAVTTFRGDWYEADCARIYTLPEEPVEVYISAVKPRMSRLAGRLGDGLIAVEPDAAVVQRFEAAGGAGKPRIGLIEGCWGRDREEALRTLRELWPLAGIPGGLGTELREPAHYEALLPLVRAEDVATRPHGPDPEPWLEQIRAYEDAGFTHVYLHQIGPDQESFFEFAQRELLSRR
jgi:G6PDH family F420-dependent oxidoreductase